MINENAQKWVAELRKPGLEQAVGALTLLTEDGEIDGECCLGVACRLYIEAGCPDGPLIVQDLVPEGRRAFTGMSTVLPGLVKRWLGLASSVGAFENESLAERNDDGATFTEIADLIESEPEGLFA